jgi:hypothetical protein
MEDSKVMHKKRNETKMMLTNIFSTALFCCAVVVIGVMPYRLLQELNSVILESNNARNPSSQQQQHHDSYETWSQRRKLIDVAATSGTLLNHTTFSSPNTYQENTSRIWTQITFSAEYDRSLIPHTLRHYVQAGLQPQLFLISLHHSHDGPAAKRSVALLQEQIRTDFGMEHIQAWYGNFTSQENWSHKIAQRRQAEVRDCDWIVKVDADEFVRVDSLPRLLDAMADRHYDVVYGSMVDRVGIDGGLSPIATDTPLSDQFPLACHVTQAGNANTTKAVAFRGYLTEYRAGHGLLYGQDSCPYPHQLTIDHYKWTDSVHTKLQTRMDHYRWLEGQGRGFHWWRESQHFLHHLQRHSDRIDVNEPAFQCQVASSSMPDVPPVETTSHCPQRCGRSA